MKVSRQFQSHMISRGYEMVVMATYTPRNVSILYFINIQYNIIISSKIVTFYFS